PMEVFIAKGAPDACGPGCDSWIAAEGRIVDDSPARLRRVLDQIGKRKMPVFFYSPGGQAVQGLAIGRKLRARGLTAGVAVTVPQNCLPTRKVDECSKLMRQPEPPQAQLWTTGASCN